MKKEQKNIQSIRTLAHDLNNTLSPLLGYTELSLEQVESDSQIHRNLKQIYKTANQAKDLIQKLLEVSREM